MAAKAPNPSQRSPSLSLPPTLRLLRRHPLPHPLNRATWMPRFSANLTFLFPELAFLDRFAAAKAAGFDAVEYVCLYDHPAEVLADAAKRADVETVLLNIPHGRWASGERGIAIFSDRVDEFRASLVQTIAYCRATGCQQVNCLAGTTPDGADTAQLRLQINTGTGTTLEDNSLIRWNYGLNVDGENTGEQGIALGLNDPILAGYENFTTERSSSASGGTGLYRLNVDLTNPAIPEGMNYLSAVAFVPRVNGLPPVFTTFRKVIYVDRRGPDADLVFPASPTGTGDIRSATYGFVLQNPDGTANTAHYFWNLPEGTNPISGGLLNDANRATKSDRTRYRFSLNNLATGPNQKLTVVLFEETGTSTIKTFNIGVEIDGAPTGFATF